MQFQGKHDKPLNLMKNSSCTQKTKQLKENNNKTLNLTRKEKSTASIKWKTDNKAKFKEFQNDAVQSNFAVYLDLGFRKLKDYQRDKRERESKEIKRLKNSIDAS